MIRIRIYDARRAGPFGGGYLLHGVRPQFLARDLGMAGLDGISMVVLFVCIHGFEDFKATVRAGAGEVLAAVNEPLDGAYEEDDAEGDNAVVWWILTPSGSA